MLVPRTFPLVCESGKMSIYCLIAGHLFCYKKKSTKLCFNKRQLNKLIEQLKATYISKGYYGIKITKEVEIDSSKISFDI
jgi:outer membrane protein assembly factor BamA